MTEPAVQIGEPEPGLPHGRMFTQAMVLTATRAFSCVELTTLQDLGCTGSAGYRGHIGTFLRG